MDVILDLLPSKSISSFDEAEIRSTLGTDPEFFRELVGIFKEQLPIQLERLESALAQGDRTALKRAAHQFIGSCIVFSAKEAVALGRLLESSADQPDLQPDGLVSAIAVSARRLLYELECFAASNESVRPTLKRRNLS